jgi:hypothetical protein
LTFLSSFFSIDIPRPVDCAHTRQGEKKDSHLRQALDAISPTQFLHFPQNRFEALLSDYLKDQNVHVERGIELIKEEDQSGKQQLYLHHR